MARQPVSAEVSFPGRHIVAAFQNVEKELWEVLRVVPYCQRHRRVWSPSLAECMVEACSQLDSLWKAEIAAVALAADHQEYYLTPEGFARIRKAGARLETAGKLNITDYFRCFAYQVARERVVFWGDSTTTLAPYGPWRNAMAHKQIPWWTTYNTLKHDRWRNITLATLEQAVSAVGALMLAVCRCPLCWSPLREAGLLSHGQGVLDPRPVIYEETQARARQLFPHGPRVVVESRLFAYPFGLWIRRKSEWPVWPMSGSVRFRGWHEQERRIHRNRSAK